MEAKIYNQNGEEKGLVKLPKEVFGLPWNNELVYQVVVSQEANKRRGTAHTKTRGEVSGTGKKPWRQKGTGQARHGSKRSPIWVGGGVAHGPRSDKNYSKKINKKMANKALAVVLSKKLAHNEIIFIDDLKLPEIKTKNAISVLNKLSEVKGFDKLKTKKTNSALLALVKKDSVIEKSFDNISKIQLDEVRNLTALQVLNKKFLIMISPKDSIALLENRIVK